MILYVVTDTYEKYGQGSVWFTVRNTLEKIAGDACIVLHYTQLDLETVNRIRPWAICHSGGATDYKDYDVLSKESYRRVILEYDAAQIGFCGGHQILASYFGSTLGPMRKLMPDEPDLSSYNPGQFKEWGVYPVRVLKPDPLFRECGKVLRVQEYHYWEVKRLGPELVLLASSRECRVQTFRHRSKPIYGTQFHPEQSSDAYPDGTKVLTNFFRLARHASGIPQKPKRAEPTTAPRRGRAPG